MASTNPWHMPNFAGYRTLFRLLGTLKQPIKIPDSVEIQRLEEPVEISWNTEAVPTIRAHNMRDAIRTQGYIHGRMRGFQMDFLRRMPAGELAEIMGPGALSNDIFMRRLNLKSWALASMKTTSKPVIALLQAYADGVNQAFLQGPTAPEYRFLKTHPRPWTMEDSLTITYTLAWQLNSIWTQKWAFDQVGRDAAANTWLFSEIADTPDITIIPGTGLPRRGWGSGGQGLGSNNWVVSGALTENGLPLLANDPHLMPLLPSIWFEMAVQGGPLDVVGASLPGSPGIIIGQNRRIAWGVTNVNPDCQDLFRIHMDDNTHYSLDGQRQELFVRPEILRVRGRADQQLICEDSHAGPIIHRESDGSRIALQWTGLSPLTLLDAVIDLNLAQDWETFNQALAGWTVPAQNFVYADIDGHIGYLLAGKIPIHTIGPILGCGDGNTRATLWTSAISAHEMPHLFDPECGYIVTANNAPIGRDFLPLIVSHDSLGYRAARIASQLHKSIPHTLKTFSRIQQDDYSDPLYRLSQRLLEEPDIPTPWRPYLEHFDGHAGIETVAPTLCYLWAMQAVPVSTLHVLNRPFFPTVQAEVPGTHPFPENFWGLMGERLIPMILAEFHHLDHRAAFTAATNRGKQAFGPRYSDWTWGRAHHTILFHPFIAVGPTKAVFGRQPVPTPGDYFSPRQAAFAVDPDLPWPRPVLFMPSYRQVLVPGHPELSRCIHLTGQSGHPLDLHYDDLITPYFDGQLLAIGNSIHITEAQPH